MLRKEIVPNEIEKDLLMQAENLVGLLSHYFYKNEKEEAKKMLQELNELLKKNLELSDFEKAMESMEETSYAEFLLTEKPQKPDTLSDDEASQILDIICQNRASRIEVNWWLEMLSMYFTIPVGKITSFIYEEQLTGKDILGKIKAYKPIIL